VSNLSIPTPSRGLFRGAVLLFAFVLACQATWILAAELSRPSLPGFPINAQAAQAIAADRNAAALAASFGFIRGDLWAEYALTYLDLFWSDGRHSPNEQDPKMIERGHKVTVWALALAPHDARIWLVLASIDLRFDWINQKAAAAALRMSYYTGPNRTELIPLRLHLAVRSEALADKDFQELVRHDIRIIVTRKPELKPTILSVYSEALPIGQQFLEEALKDLDPSLRARLRPKADYRMLKGTIID
jgi:hypothetical protein